MEIDDNADMLTTMRQYLGEFDPDSGPVDSSGSGQQVQLIVAWKTYLQTFDDLCQVRKIANADKKPLLLLLGGMKLRERLASITASSAGSIDQVKEVLTKYFESKTSVQSMRYEFLYGMNSRPMPGESPASWAARLASIASNCDFENMTPEDALALVMSKYGKVEAASKKRKAIQSAFQPRSKIMNNGGQKNSSSGQSANHHITIDSATNQIQDEEGDDADIADNNDDSYQEPLEVELEWGEDRNSNQGSNEPGSDPADPGDQISIKSEFIDPEPVQDFDSFDNGVAASRRRVPLVVSSSPGVNEGRSGGAPKGLPCNCPNCKESPKGRASRHKCHIEGCGKEYAKTSHLRAHLGSHNTVLPYGCEWPGCEKRFYRTDQLTRHERTHTGEKRFTCFVCNKAFSRSDHLNKHAKRHTPEELLAAGGPLPKGHAQALAAAQAHVQSQQIQFPQLPLPLIPQQSMIIGHPSQP